MNAIICVMKSVSNTAEIAVDSRGIRLKLREICPTLVRLQRQLREAIGSPYLLL